MACISFSSTFSSLQGQVPLQNSRWRKIWPWPVSHHSQRLPSKTAELLELHPTDFDGGRGEGRKCRSYGRTDRQCEGATFIRIRTRHNMHWGSGRSQGKRLLQPSPPSASNSLRDQRGLEKTTLQASVLKSQNKDCSVALTWGNMWHTSSKCGINFDFRI